MYCLKESIEWILIWKKEININVKVMLTWHGFKFKSDIVSPFRLPIQIDSSDLLKDW